MADDVSGVVNKANEASEVGVEGSSWRAVGLFFNKTWLLNTFTLCRIFSSSCVLPAVLLTTGGLCLTVGEFFSFSQVPAENVQIASILMAMGILLVTMFLVLGFFISGFGLWMVRLSTFSHAFFSIDMSSKLPANSDIQEIFASSHAFILSRKKYLAEFYFVLSLAMVLPVIWFLTLLTVKAFSMAPPSSAVVDIKVALPAGVDALVMVLIAVFGGYLVGVSFCAVAVSSASKEPAKSAAWECIKLSFRLLLPMMVTVVVVLIMNTLIATPQLCLHPIEYFSLVNTTRTLPSSICSELWEGVTSVYFVYLIPCSFL